MKGTTQRFDELVKLAALATLDHTRIKRYMPGGEQELSGGWSNLDDFDLATVPVCGRVRDDWLAVDIDVNCAELADRQVKRVCDLIEHALECPVLVFDSGSRERFGRHVWAWVGPEPASPTLIEAINSSPDTGVRSGGSLMRPPLGLHRRGGRSLPLNVDCEELVELFASVPTPEPASRPAPKKNEGLFERLNPNAQALLEGDVGPKHRKSDGTPDRSKVDAALATHAVNSGLSEADFIELRYTHYPSEKALEQRDPLGYLRDKYQAAQRLPASSDPGPPCRERSGGSCWPLRPAHDPPVIGVVCPAGADGDVRQGRHARHVPVPDLAAGAPTPCRRWEPRDRETGTRDPEQRRARSSRRKRT